MSVSDFAIDVGFTLNHKYQKNCADRDSVLTFMNKLKRINHLVNHVMFQALKFTMRVLLMN